MSEIPLRIIDKKTGVEIKVAGNVIDTEQLLKIFDDIRNEQAKEGIK